MRFPIQLATLYLLILIHACGIAQSITNPSDKTPWRLEKDRNGIQVYSRLPEGESFKEMKVICELDGSCTQIVTFLSDVDNYKAVVYKTKKAYMIKQVSEQDFYYYTESSLPWPVKNRDMVVHMQFKADLPANQLLIQATDVAGLVPPQPDIVRIPYWRSVWVVKKMSPSRIRIEYAFRVDPGGDLPTWFVNLTAAVGPYTSFSKLEQHLKLPRYQGKSYAFLPF